MREIKSLVEKAKKYLRSAEILLKEGDYESYGFKNLLCNVLLRASDVAHENLSFSSHKGVISAFGEHFVKRKDN